MSGCGGSHRSIDLFVAASTRARSDFDAWDGAETAAERESVAKVPSAWAKRTPDLSLKCSDKGRE